MKIYLDYDSTLVDFNTPYLKFVNEKVGTKYTTKDLKTWLFIEEQHGEGFDVWRQEGFYRNVFPLPMSQIFVDTLRHIFGSRNVFILTSSAEETKAEKHKHIKHYYNFAECNIIHDSKKHPHTKDGILVDDYMKNISGHVENNNKPGILFNYQKSYGWCEDINTDLVTTLHTYPDTINYLKNKL